jgi:hypothetical protein
MAKVEISTKISSPAPIPIPSAAEGQIVAAVVSPPTAYARGWWRPRPKTDTGHNFAAIRVCVKPGSMRKEKIVNDEIECFSGTDCLPSDILFHQVNWWLADKQILGKHKLWASDQVVTGLGG